MLGSLGVVGYVVDGVFAELERRVVVLASCMLDEEQGGRYCIVAGILFCRLAHNSAVEHGLQIVVAVLRNVEWVEHTLR